MELLILFILIVINGVFSMSELAIVSSRKAYLQERLEQGQNGAKAALELLEEPNRFLSTVQIGITLIGIIAGAFGGSAIAGSIAEFIRINFPALATWAEEIGFGLIVSLTTYLSLVIGELVPKRIALRNPEQVAVLIAPMMQGISRITSPIVWFLSKSTELVARLLGVSGDDSQFITDFEVIAMMREGISAGEFMPEEHAMVKGALELDDIRVREILTPRTEMVLLHVNDSPETIQNKIRADDFTVYPVTDGDADAILGLVFVKDVLFQLLSGKGLDLRAILHQALYVPETAIVADVLRQFKRSLINMALVLDEHGGIAGIVTLTDILEEVLGDVDMLDEIPIQRADGSWLFDGIFPISDIPQYLADFHLPEDEESDYTTLAGFVLTRLGRIPKASDFFEWHGYKLEVMDMDGKRVDKVLVQRL